MSWKISEITFVEHPVLGNLTLNFNTPFGVADTVIFAGENGTGKSTVIDSLYKIVSGQWKSKASMRICRHGESRTLTIQPEGLFIYVSDGSGNRYTLGSEKLKAKYHLNGIYSDVGINFSAENVSTVTSKTLDSSTASIRSTSSLPKEIKQLIVDIQALDDHDVSEAYRKAKNENADANALVVDERMPRFTRAFSRVFDGLMYDTVINSNGHKEILFKKYGKKIPIDGLSSGEKQIIYRGAFLLKDANSLSGATVFIDEPEISLHPIWQMRVMDFYKGIFTNEKGDQTSQIFAVTHSPFVIHNDNRRNDKVIILARDNKGDIIVKDKPEYFKCDSVEAVQDAFSIHGFSAEKPTVYLEGRTDAMYFNKALEVYGINVPFQFKWIGYIDAKGEEANTGKDALNKALPFLISRQLPVKNVCLYDCDTNKPKKEVNNVIMMSLPKYENDKGIRIGVENALVFGDIDVEPYKKQRVEVDGYGIEKRIPDFQKMECCKHICSLDNEHLKLVFANLKTIIEDLVQLFSED